MTLHDALWIKELAAALRDAFDGDDVDIPALAEAALLPARSRRRQRARRSVGASR